MEKSHAGHAAARGLFALLLAVPLLTGCSVRTPFVVSPAFGPVVCTYATSIGHWANQLAEAAGARAGRVIAIPQFDSDGAPGPGLLYAWARDGWICGWLGGRPAALLTPGAPALHAWARAQFSAQRWTVLSAGEKKEGPARRFDAGGNVLVTPPLPGRPHGRLIVGRGMQPALKKFFRAQKVQTSPGGRLIEVDTSWLRVGHVDEIISFVPADGKPGFKLVLPDPAAALRLLRTVPSDRALFYAAGSREATGTVTGSGTRFLEDRRRKFGGGRWAFVRITAGKGAGQVAKVRGVKGRRLIIEKVWDLRGRSPLAGLRAALAGRCDTMPIWFEKPDKTSRYLVVEGTQFWLDGAGDPVPAVMTAGELAGDRLLAGAVGRVCDRLERIERTVREALGGLQKSRIVRLPVLPLDDGTGADVWWLTPNPVNLVNLDGIVILLRTFGPRKKPPAADGDVLAQAIRSALAGVQVRFADGWNALHRSGGGARCGTNILRRWGSRRRGTGSP